jgi:competence protein ComEC
VAAAALERVLAGERAQLPLWLPVLFGAGIALYFGWPREPSAFVAPAGLAAALAVLGASRRPGSLLRLAGLALVVVALGFAAAQIRAHAVGAPVLPSRIEARIEGRVIEVSRSSGGAQRLLLDRLAIEGLDPALTPERVRITLRRDDTVPWMPGSRIAVLAAVGPPGAPVEPGGFDFRRHAWFDRLGGIGLARARVEPVGTASDAGPLDRLRIAVAAFRTRLTEALRQALPGEAGAFAAAILVGDQSGLPEEAREALRASNLSHLLSISGLHMGLLTGFVFLGLRLCLALSARAALGWPTRKIAAAAAMLAGLLYLALSGAQIPAQRSWIMVAVFFGAVLLDRMALSLRSVALAAMILLVLSPESLVDVGFQMSFAATVALVAGFDWLAGKGWQAQGGGLLGRAGMMALTSLIAGTATAPFAAYAFNQTALWGLVANMLAVPVMGFLVMPAGVIAGLLAPAGLEGPPLWAMGQGIDLIMAIARWVAGFPGAILRVPATAAPVLLPVALGGLWLCLWQGRVRLAGPGIIAAGFVWWALTIDRPELLIAESGRQVGLAGPEGRAVLAPSRETFVVRQWLQADGEDPDRAADPGRSGLVRGRDWARGTLGPWRVEVVTARVPAPTRIARLCTEKVVLVAPGLDRPPPGPCIAITGATLRERGALAYQLKGEALVARAVRDPAGPRLWTRAAAR